MTLRARTATIVSQLLDRLQPSESVVLGIAAVVVGVSDGAGIWFFKEVIHWFEGFWLSSAPGAPDCLKVRQR